MVMIVTRKLSAVAIDEAPANWTPRLKNDCPNGAPGRERRVAGPAGVEGAARGEEAADEEDPGQRQHPEAERVEAREGHVRRADHQRQDVVREPGEDRDHEDEDHQHRVRREEAVVGRRFDDLGAGLGELGPDQHRHQAAEEEEDEGGDDVLDTDHLVVGVEFEVVLPALGAVLGVVVGNRRQAGGPAQPVVEAAEAGEEAERSGDRGHDYVRVAGLFGLVQRQVGDRPQGDDEAEAERAEGDGSEQATPPAGSLDRGNHQLTPLCPSGIQGRGVAGRGLFDDFHQFFGRFPDRARPPIR